MSGVKIFRFEGPLLYLSYDYFKRTLIAKTGLDPSGLYKYAAGERCAHKPPSQSTPSHVTPPPPTVTPNPVSLPVEELYQQQAANGEVYGQNAIALEHGGPQNTIAPGASTSSTNTNSPTEEDPQQLRSRSIIVVPPDIGRTMHNDIVVIDSSNGNATEDTGGAFNVAYTHDSEWRSMSSTCRPGLHQSKSMNSGVCSLASDAGHPQMIGTTCSIDMVSIDRVADEEAGVNARQLVLDCSSWSAIDYTALEQLVEVGESLNLRSPLVRTQ